MKGSLFFITANLSFRLPIVAISSRNLAVVTLNGRPHFRRSFRTQTPHPQSLTPLPLRCCSACASPVAAGNPKTDSLRAGRSDFRVRSPLLFGIFSRVVRERIVEADDRCRLLQVPAVIRFGGRIQFRSPPAKHWAPFVRGCAPAASDPGHDKGRLTNR